jgi:hypothetical protein
MDPAKFWVYLSFYADDFSKIAKDKLAQNHDFRIEPLTACTGVLLQQCRRSRRELDVSNTDSDLMIT